MLFQQWRGRLLVLTTRLPYPPTTGFQMRTWQVIRALAAEGCEIHLLSLDNPASPDASAPELLRVCESVEVIPFAQTSLSSSRNYLERLVAFTSRYPFAVSRFRSAAMRVRILERVEHADVDAVLSDTPYPMINLPDAIQLPVMVNCHNVEHVLLLRYAQHESNPILRTYARIEANKLRRWEESICSRSKLLMACSEEDKRQLKSFSLDDELVIVPNVIEVTDYPPVSGDDDTTVLFTGGMDWMPNRDAVEFFVANIWPQLQALVPRVRFVVAGRDPGEKFRKRYVGFKGVTFTGQVADMRFEIAKAAVCVVPLRIGSGTRLKILEAAGMGKPVVSTRIGTEGLDFSDGQEILIADSPEEFAQAVARLLTDPILRSEMGKAGRSRVLQNYSPAALKAAICTGLRAFRRASRPGSQAAPIEAM
jgi:glycosyltransferase involved in cell wall biosynthesis